MDFRPEGFSDEAPGLMESTAKFRFGSTRQAARHRIRELSVEHRQGRSLTGEERPLIRDNLACMIAIQPQPYRYWADAVCR